MVGSADSRGDVLLAEVTRGEHVESEHFGAVAVVLPDGGTWSRGDAERPIWVRSAVKPFQALPLLERGVDLELGCDDQERAVLVASHEGTERHVAVVERLLGRAGLTSAALCCGAHAPLAGAARRELLRRGEEPRPVHNNCSGKHAGFVLLARALGEPTETCLDPDGAVQRVVRETVAAMTGTDADELPVAVDGCGAPTFHLPLTALARGFARLLNHAGLDDVRAAACGRLFSAITAEPFHLSGDGRLCAALIAAAPGAVWPKNGAEGVYAAAFRTAAGVGALAVKVRDGATRGYQPVVVALLLALGLWDAVPDALAEFGEPVVRNTLRREVGRVRCALEIPSFR